MNLDKKEHGYIFTMNIKEGHMNIANRNYLLRFRNMLEPQEIYVTYNNNRIKYNYRTEKNDLLIELKDINPYNKLEVEIIGDDLEIETVSVINEEIEGILDDLEVATILKEKIDKIIFSELPINKKRIEIRKLKKDKLEPKFINMFISLLEFIENK